MADIFGREDLTYGGSFAADSAVVSMSSIGCGLPVDLGTGAVINVDSPSDLATGVGLLAQNIGYVYQQPVQRFFELGSNKVYYFAGRPSGQGSIGRLLGPRAISAAFYQAFGNVCCAGTNVMGITVGAKCTFNGHTVQQAMPQGSSLMSWFMSGVILTSVGGQIAAEDMIFREQLSFMFFRLGQPTVTNSLPFAGSVAANPLEITGATPEHPGAALGDPSLEPEVLLPGS